MQYCVKSRSAVSHHFPADPQSLGSKEGFRVVWVVGCWEPSIEPGSGAHGKRPRVPVVL